MVKLISEMGWHEHTNDWDLYSVINEIHTETGYPEIELISDHPIEGECLSIYADKITKIKYISAEDEGMETYDEINIDCIDSIYLRD